MLWYWATFGPSGGPKTLQLYRNGPRNCYLVVAQDDTGQPGSGTGAVVHVDGRSVPTTSGAACVGRHVGLVRATRPGAIRSNALR